MSFTLYYASKKTMFITSVCKFVEDDARAWFGRVLSWRDVVRVRLVNDDTKEIVSDQTLEARILDPDNPKLEERTRELVGRMDKVFVANAQHTRRTRSDQPHAATLTVNTRSDERCRCGHARVEHNGATGDGYCHGQCLTKCPRFRRAG